MTLAAETTSPPPIMKIEINVGPIHVTYEGPADFASKLPDLLKELKDIATVMTAIPPKPQ
jgi:hypothetical protein